MLLTTLPILAMCMIFMGASAACFNLSEKDWLTTISKWTSLILMIVYLFSYSAGMASIPWLINSEIYPLFLIGSASALSASVNWITAFMMTSIFDKTNKVVSIEAAGICNIICYIFVRLFVKETKGNSITKNVALMLNKSQREVT